MPEDVWKRRNILWRNIDHWFLYPTTWTITMSFLPLRLLAKQLQRSGCWKHYLQYQKALHKIDNNSCRIKYLENCKRADIIPKFLKFRVPNNDCFDETSIHNFQKTLLNKELQKAKTDTQTLSATLKEKRQQLRSVVPEKTLPSVPLYTRLSRHDTKKEQRDSHQEIGCTVRGTRPPPV